VEAARQARRERAMGPAKLEKEQTTLRLQSVQRKRGAGLLTQGGPGGPTGPLGALLRTPGALSRLSITRWKPFWDPLMLAPGACG
jgi:hypothetical protein